MVSSQQSVVSERKIKSYRDLFVWQKARALVKAIYQASQSFPSSETYGLSQQLQRAAISVPSNIAEGSAKQSSKEFIRFLNIAYGSLCEIETQLYIAEDLGYISDTQCNELLTQTSEIGRMLNGLRKSLSTT